MSRPEPSLPSSRFRAADLLLVPSLLSLLRVPLAVAFAFALDRPWVAFGLLVASAITDLLDGFLARRWNQVTETGAALDGITDKLFVLTVAVSMVVGGELSLLVIALLSVRELVETPLLLWVTFSEQARRAGMEQPMANLAGKLTTALQLVVVSAAVFGAAWATWVAYGAALAGAYAGYRYARDVIRVVRRGDVGAGPSPYSARTYRE